jgi:uncharacterized protein DUF5615
MPLKYLFDEHLRGPLWRAVRRYNIGRDEVLDVVRVGDPSDLPLEVDDPTILRWTEREERILVTFDRHTMPIHLADHLAAGRHCPGIFMLPIDSAIQSVINFLVLAAYASQPQEWLDRIEYLHFSRSS